MLLHEFDPSQEAVFNPCIGHPPIPGFPKVAVSCFSYVTFQRLIDSLNAEPFALMKTASQQYPVYKTCFKGVDVALYLSGVGAPVCVGSLEEMFSMGAEAVVLFGSCGVLDKDIGDCSIILPTSALRDEGTSYHYAPPGDEIAVNTRYGQLFAHMLDELHVSHTAGKCWTTDAMYRETREKVARRKEQGCICVDMECASCAAVAQFREKDVLQFFYAADNLDAKEWDQRSLSNFAKLDEKDSVALLALEAAVRIHHTIS